MPIQGYDSGRFWEEKYNALLQLILEMKEGKLTVLIRRFQPVGRVSYRKAEEYAMTAIDNGYLKVTSCEGKLLDADEAGRELKAGRDVHFEASLGTVSHEKTERRFDVEKCRFVQMPVEEDENVTQYMRRKEKMKEVLRKKLREKIRSE